MNIKNKAAALVTVAVTFGMVSAGAERISRTMREAETGWKADVSEQGLRNRRSVHGSNDCSDLKDFPKKDKYVA